MDTKADRHPDDALAGVPVRAAVEAEDLIFVAAQNGRSGAASRDSTTAPEQIEIALDKVSRILASRGSAVGDIVKLNLFYLQHADIDEPELLRRIRRRFAGTPPALTAIPLRNLPLSGMRLELNAIAVRGSAAPGARTVAPGPGPWPQPAGAEFSHAVRCGKFIFVGGQMALDKDGGTLHEGDIVGQAKATIRNISTVLGQLGAEMSAVVKLNTFYVGFGTTEDWAMAAKVRSDAFVKPGPGATGVPVVGPYPRNLLLRQDCMAIVGPDEAPAPRKTSWPEGHWDWPIPVSFEQGLLLGRTIVLGGQISADIKGKAVHPGDLAAQTAETMTAIRNILAGFGADLQDLATLTVLYATEGAPEDLKKVLTVLRGYYPAGLPAFTAVPLAKLGMDDIRVEIEGIGVVKGTGAAD